MNAAPIILVPGFWLGAWAWDDVAAALRADGHDVSALTLPGLESAGADRSKVTFDDHVGAIVNAVEAANARVVLAVHSGAGASGYAGLRNVTWIDLPTSHWPMWSRTKELAAIIGERATSAAQR